MSKKKPTAYTKPAGGMDALLSSVGSVVSGKATNLKSFLRVNRPGGFDCPGCAWPEPAQPSRLEFCENGVKAVVAEITNRRVTRDFFEKHDLQDLRSWSGFELEKQGRLTEPMRLDPKSGHYQPIDWEEAYNLVGRHLRALNHPDEALFYTSGRTSNEAAFLYQLFGRMLGTNNFPDCSNMCHESSGVAMTETIGIGKGTVTLEDFHLADAIFIFGQNPGTNHPRMLTELEKASQRGCKIVSFNPLVEPGLVSFIHPKKTSAVLRNKKSVVSSLYLQPQVGGDLAAVTGMIKLLLEREASGGVLDLAFIRDHTEGFASLKEHVYATSWQAIERNSGLTRQELEKATNIYLRAERTIICWAMGLTQQKQAVGTIQNLINLLLLKGNIGKPGAGACPVRGHSNVQGDRTVGIVESPPEALLEGLERTFHFRPPKKPGTNTVEAIEAMAKGKAKVMVCMGGNFAAATPDSSFTESAIQNLDLTVQISTKLNRSHVITGKEALILPCLGRTEIDTQASGQQQVTVEDSMSMVHASRGHKQPASKHLRSEPAIVAGLAKASLPATSLDWDALIENYDRIREKMAQVFPQFEGYNQKIQNPGGFYLGNSARERKWQTLKGRARFTVHPLPQNHTEEGQLKLMTIRSHDQYNTTIYGLNDRYRGIKGTRKVVFVNPSDMTRRKLVNGDKVNLISHDPQGKQRIAAGFSVVAYNIPEGCAAAYFPETNVLVPIGSYADKSFTPTSKFIPISLQPHSVPDGRPS